MLKKMKTIQIFLFLTVFGILNAQNLAQGFNQMSPEKRKETINKMSPEERTKLMKEFRENIMVEELEIPDEKQEEFRKIYSEYLEKQREIKSRFQRPEDYNAISDEEAKQKLNQSFDVGQQLLNNRKEYAGKFMKICRPQQVLKMYQTEGMIREKMMDRKTEKSENGKKRIK